MTQITFDSQTVTLVLGVVFLAIAALVFLRGTMALRKPLVHDGIGGEDTNNLAKGCMAPFVAFGFAMCGVICLVVSGVIRFWGG